jgi:histidine triad (HIT) family protein
MVDCAFCAIVAGRAEASVVAATDAALAFLDQRQAVSGHVLVVPRIHAEDIYALDPDTAAALMRLALRVVHALRAAFDPPGLSLWQSNGDAAFQEVPHVHLHLQPRFTDDRLLRVYPGAAPAPLARVELDRMAGAIRDHLSS